jgi:phosphoribosylanthranilate isomerase
MKVKICGLRTYDEAMAAIEAGADLLGFNFYKPSPRYITPWECMRLQVKLQIALQGMSHRKIIMVGVFVNYGANETASVLGDCNLDLAQLSGDETPEEMAALGEKAFKALRTNTAEELERAITAYPRRSGSPSWLIDANRPGSYGGSGLAADWSLARMMAVQSPILLAGGLTAENIGVAIRQVHPWGVDVASGVESSPGCKDPTRMTAFIQAAQRAEEEFLA